MNLSRAIFLISDDVRAVMVNYDGVKTSDGRYKQRAMYKTMDPEIQVGDLVVIPTDTRHHMTVCRVVEVDVEPDLEATGDLNWIITTVNARHHEDIKQQEAQAVATIRSAEKKRKKEELRKTLLAGAEEDLKLLPIAGGPDADFAEVE